MVINNDSLVMSHYALYLIDYYLESTLDLDSRV